MFFKILSDDEQRAKGAGSFDDMDMIYSPHGGHIVVVAQKRDSGGMLQHVCWACGELFEPDRNPDLAGVEKVQPGGTVPILLHRRCSGKSNLKSFFEASKDVGSRAGRAAARFAQQLRSVRG